MSDFAVDLTNCDREPIHLPGAIQPFGFLIAVSQSDLRVTHASHNAVAWLDREADALIGCPLDQIFAAAATRTIVSHLSHAILGDTVARVFGVSIDGGDAVCDLAVHAVGTTAIIECEPSSGVEAINAGAAVRGMVSRLQLTEDMRAFHRIAARELQELTGFDRVMLYRFDHDGSGEVIAESTVSGIGSYLGLHYPASDIPRQARVLYERNWLRIIPDIGARPSAIVSAGGNGDQPLDLSMSILRSVSPIHIEYLQNMGVQASMSVSILVQGKLWGLLACHHYAPHHITFERRTAAELFGQMFSLMMENRERSNESVYEENSRKLHNQIISAWRRRGSRPRGLFRTSTTLPISCSATASRWPTTGG